MFFKHIIKYSQCWEDTDVLVSALILEDDDVVLSITSGGDNSLALSGFTKKRLISIDMNIHQNYLLELKLLSIKELEYDEVIKFLEFYIQMKESNTIILLKKNYLMVH